MAQPEDFRTAARYYASRGWPVFPVHGIVDGHCTCGDPSCSLSNHGKHPSTDHGHLDARLEDTAAFWPDILTRNIAIATGNGLAVVDIDPRNGGFEAWDEFVHYNPNDDFDTYTVATGGGGTHLYFSVEGPCPTMPNLLRGVDLKADGGYVLAPPSTHISGGVYRTSLALPIRPLQPSVLEIVRTGDRPAGLKHTPPGRVSGAGMTSARQREILDDPTKLGPGERDTFFAFTARDLCRAGTSFQDTIITLGNIYDRMLNPEDDSFTPQQMIAKVERAFATIDPEPTRENRKIAEAIVRSTRVAVHDSVVIEDATADEVEVLDPNHWSTYDIDTPGTVEVPSNWLPTPAELPEPPRRVILSPDGYKFPEEIWERWNGERPMPWLANDDGLAALAQIQWGHRLRYDLDSERWLFYNNKLQHWVENSDAEAAELMKLTVRSVERVIAMDTEDDDEQSKLLVFAAKSLNDAPIKSALRSLSTREGIRVHNEELNNAGYSLPVENGVIEPTFFGEEYADIPFRLHSPDDLFTRHSKLIYDHEARSPLWDDNLLKWFPDPEVRAFAKRLLGYAVFGGGQEKMFVVAHGDRDSGKSGFFNNIRDFLGEFAVTLNAESVTKKRNPDPNHFDLAKISGARLILATETAHGASYDTELLKVLASGGEDALHVRYLHKNFVEVRNKGLLVIMTNHLPRNQQLDDALWSRLVILPFQGYFPKGHPDTILSGQLKEMLSHEREGILRWIVEGYAEYVETGLMLPEATVQAVEDARAEEDWLSAWILDRCSTEDPQAAELFRDVYDDYAAWCLADKNEPVGKNLFGSLLGERYTKKRGSSNKVTVYGLRLNTRPEQLSPLPEGWRP